MPTEISKEEYLKRYLNKGETKDGKKKRKKKLAAKSKPVKSNFQIIDYDADVPVNTEGSDVDDIEILEDEEPEIKLLSTVTIDELKLMGKFNANSFKTFQQIKQEIKEEESTGRHDSSSEGGSPIARRRFDSDSDEDNDIAQTSTAAHEDISSTMSQPEIKQEPIDTDNSPPRKIGSKEDEDLSPPRKNNRSRDQSPPRRRKLLEDDDQSPPRNNRSRDQSPPRRRKLLEDDDQSPPRNNRSRDQSPPRRRKLLEDDNQSPPRKRGRDQEDLSPPRRNFGIDPDQDLDLSPPRQVSKDESRDGRGFKMQLKTDKMKKTLSGASAGLQSASQLKKEAIEMKKREDAQFRTLDDRMSGRNAETQMRADRRRNAEAKAVQEEEKKKKQEELKKKYDKWNKGLKQLKDRDVRLEEMSKEVNKPLARYEGDEDLEEHLKKVEHSDDPMLAYIKNKHTKKAVASGKKMYPQYKGPLPAPNRFGIQPGYRWDGVDRSNGFEAKLFETKNTKKAEEAELYRFQAGMYE